MAVTEQWPMAGFYLAMDVGVICLLRSGEWPTEFKIFGNLIIEILIRGIPLQNGHRFNEYAPHRNPTSKLQVHPGINLEISKRELSSSNLELGVRS